MDRIKKLLQHFAAGAPMEQIGSFNNDSLMYGVPFQIDRYSDNDNNGLLVTWREYKPVDQPRFWQTFVRMEMPD